jgi:uncharacterized protein YcbX
MSRNKAVTVPVSDLPAYFRSEHDANLIALAIEAEAQHTRDAANAEGAVTPADKARVELVKTATLWDLRRATDGQLDLAAIRLVAELEAERAS